jgi:uncharacterized membrane protein HdeD (DUF308 family)
MLEQLPPDVARELQKSWKWLMALGILLAVVGLIAIIVPAAASVAITRFLGVIIIIAAVFQLIEAFQYRAPWPIVWRVLLAALFVLAGVWLIARPIQGTITLTIILVAWFWATGVVRLIAAFQNRGIPGAGWLAFSGILSIVLGALIWGDLPSSAAWAIGLLVGIQFLFDGMGLAFTAWRLKGGGGGATPRPA